MMLVATQSRDDGLRGDRSPTSSPSPENATHMREKPRVPVSSGGQSVSPVPQRATGSEPRLGGGIVQRNRALSVTAPDTNDREPTVHRSQHDAARSRRSCRRG